MSRHVYFIENTLVCKWLWGFVIFSLRIYSFLSVFSFHFFICVIYFYWKRHFHQAARCHIYFNLLGIIIIIVNSFWYNVVVMVEVYRERERETEKKLSLIFIIENNIENVEIILKWRVIQILNVRQILKWNFNSFKILFNKTLRFSIQDYILNVLSSPHVLMVYIFYKFSLILN